MSKKDLKRKEQPNLAIPSFSFIAISDNQLNELKILKESLSKLKDSYKDSIELIVVDTNSNNSVKEIFSDLTGISVRITDRTHKVNYKEALQEAVNSCSFETTGIIQLKGLEQLIHFNNFFSSTPQDFSDKNIHTIQFDNNESTFIQRTREIILLPTALAKQLCNQLSIKTVRYFDEFYYQLRHSGLSSHVLNIQQKSPFTKKTFSFCSFINFFKIRFNWFVKLPIVELFCKKEKPQFLQESSFYRFIFLFLALAIMVAMPIMSYKAGITGDEVVNYNHAQNVYKYYTTMGKDSSCLHTGETKLKYYGQSFDNITAIIINIFNIDKVYETRHILNSLSGWLAILFTGLLVTVIAGWRAGVITLIMMFLSPPFIGQSWNNPKDIPFTMAYIITLYFLVLFIKELPYYSYSISFFLAAGIAMSISVRIGGLLLIAYVFMFAGLMYLYQTKFKNIFTAFHFNRLIKMGIILIIISILAYLMGLILWPYALLNPIKNPLESLKLMTNFDVALRQLFEGKQLWSDSVPWYYTLKYISISTPLIVLTGIVFFLLFIFGLSKQYKGLFIFLLFFAFAFPIFYIIYKKSNVYGGWRHILFTYPTFVALAAIGYETLLRFVKKRAIKIILICAIALQAFQPLRHIIVNHPYEYIYFNEIYGGASKAAGIFETDYYFHSLKESSEWLIKNRIDTATLDSGKKITVITNHSPILNYYFRNLKDKVTVRYVRYYERGDYDWDYAIYANTYISPYQIKQNTWPPYNSIKNIYVDKAIIGTVLERKYKYDFEANEAYKRKDILNGITLFEEAIKKEPNNETALLNAAQLYSDIENFDRAFQHLNKLLTIFPNYDHALNLMGVCYLKKNDFANAIRTYIILLRENPKYYSAYFNLGLAYLNNNQSYDAIEYFKKAIEYDPGNKMGYYALAEAFNRIGKKEEANNVMEYAKQLQ